MFGVETVATTGTGVTGATGGLVVRMSRLALHRPGLELGLGFLVPSATNPVFRRYAAAAAELGAAYTVPRGAWQRGARDGATMTANGSGPGFAGA